MVDLSTGMAIRCLPAVHDYPVRFHGLLDRQNRERRRAFVDFADGRVIAYACWDAKEHGARLWRLFVAQAGGDLVPIQWILDTPLGEAILLVLRHSDVGGQGVPSVPPGPLCPPLILIHMPATAPVAALAKRQGP